MKLFYEIIFLLARHHPLIRGRQFVFRNLWHREGFDSFVRSKQSEVKTRRGFVVCCQERDRVSDWIRLWGQYEVPTERYILEQMKTGGVFVDIGSNVGYFSFLAATSVPGEVNVWAFEPNPKITSLLRRSGELNGCADRVRVFPVGLSEKEAPGVLSVDQSNSGMSHLETALDEEDETEEVEVPIRIFDSLVEEEKLPGHLRCVKIDVEGHELQVLKGMRKTLEADQPSLIVEIVPEQLARYDTSEEELAAFIESLGYEEVGRQELNRYFEAGGGA